MVGRISRVSTVALTGRLMAFTTAAGAGFMPNPAFEGVVLPVTETRTMTSTASTTRAVAKIAAVMAVLRFGASLAGARREAAPPARPRPAGGEPDLVR